MKPDAARLSQLFGADAVGAFDSSALLPVELASVPVVSPVSLAAAAEIMTAAAREGWRVWPTGAGEHLQKGAPAAPPDVVVSTRRLCRIVEFEPEEMVLVAEAGVTLHAIDALAAPYAQRLASDVWPGRAATIGGAAAANRFGLDRLRAGTLRDALLGARVVHADGRVSKTGGKVVKNVAGFDLDKLYVGSCGSLALVAELNLRLVPRPRDAALVVAVVERAHAQGVLLALYRSPLVPRALLLVAGDVAGAIPSVPGTVAIVARFEGAGEAVRWQVVEALRLAGGEAWGVERARVAYDALRASAEPRGDRVLVRISSLPTAGVAVLEGLEALPAWGRGGGCVVQFGAGTTHAQLPGLAPRDLRILRGRIAAQGARLAVECAPAGFDCGEDPGLDPVVLDLVRRTQVAFDPEGRLRPAPGQGGAA